MVSAIVVLSIGASEVFESLGSRLQVGSDTSLMSTGMRTPSNFSPREMTTIDFSLTVSHQRYRPAKMNATCRDAEQCYISKGGAEHAFDWYIRARFRGCHI